LAHLVNEHLSISSQQVNGHIKAIEKRMKELFLPSTWARRHESVNPVKHAGTVGFSMM